MLNDGVVTTLDAKSTDLICHKPAEVGSGYDQVKNIVVFVDLITSATFYAISSSGNASINGR